MNQLGAVFDRWVSRGDATPRDLGIYRIVFALLILLSPPSFRWVSQFPDSFVNGPAGPFALLHSVPPDGVLLGLELLVGTCAGFLLVGLFTRTASIVLALALVGGYGTVYSLGKIDHTIFLVIVPVLLAFARWGDALSVDALRRGAGAPVAETPQWPLRLLALLVGLGFLTAAVPKVLSGWLDPRTHAVQGVMFTQYYVNDRTDLLAGHFIGLHDGVFWESVDVATVLLEGLLVLTVLNWRCWRVGIAIASLFHLGVLLMMNIGFSGNVVTYAAFVLWARSPLLRREVPRATAAQRLAARPGSARITPVAAGVLALALGVGAVLRPEAWAVPRLNQVVVVVGAALALWYLVHVARDLLGRLGGGRTVSVVDESAGVRP
ncbi:HTTM domain-containing protein [Kineococcus sp. NBC_00420]|uniref:HTTM domain-containing protein n=1 Tax=unclassified Kineococcus TaxID=2621656 RepID=UPI002E21F411